MTAQKKKNTKTVTLTDSAILKGWTTQIPNCSGCGGTDKKRYSGSNCSTCYTTARNERLGIGKDSTEARAKRLEKLKNKVKETELLLSALKSELKSLEG